MKNFRSLAIFIIVAIVAAATMANAGGRRSPLFREQVVRDLASNYSVLARQSYHSLTTTEVAAPEDTSTTATFTDSIAYLGTTIKPPLKLRIQNFGANKIYYNIYDTNASGAIVTTATCSYLVGKRETATSAAELSYGEAAEFIFYQVPTVSFGGGGSACTFTSEIWTPEDSPYQE
jgi:hypothetical protein